MWPGGAGGASWGATSVCQAPLPQSVPLALHRNLILKMVTLGILCYHWLGRRVGTLKDQVRGGPGGAGEAEGPRGSRVRDAGVPLTAAPRQPSPDWPGPRAGWSRAPTGWAAGGGARAWAEPPLFQCWETFVGQELYRLLVLDFLFTLLDTFFGELVWR